MAPSKTEVYSPTEGDDDWKKAARDDDEEIARLINNDTQGMQDLGSLLNVEFSQVGKADDAEDFEDISDDDLPDEEDAVGPASFSEVPGLTDDTGTSGEADDLFGGEPSSPNDMSGLRTSPPRHTDPSQDPDSIPNDSFLSDFSVSALNGLAPSNQDFNIPAAPEDVFELVAQAFPTFEKGIILNFNEQLAPQPSYRIAKKLQNQRAPKPLAPTKLSLELEADTEKLFKVPGPAHATHQQKINDAEANGFVSCLVPEVADELSRGIWNEFDEDDDSEMVGGFNLRDLEIATQDWDALVDSPTPPLVPQAGAQIADDEEDEWTLEFLGPRPKRRKIIHVPGLPEVPRFVAPNFDNFEEATARAAMGVYLDDQDQQLLVDDDAELQPQANRHKVGRKRRIANERGNISQRFNISNDAEYAQLREGKIRGHRAQIGSVQVEHSMPAKKLLWPYYRITNVGPEPQDYHRPQLQTSKAAGFVVKMVKPQKLSRKEKKSKRVQEQFATSKDLTLNDNSTSVLFEYCEEIPMVLNKFGMGNKILNYYRDKSREDKERPTKSELGDQQFLLPDDKSPFSIFGTINPGETVATLHNPMYKAPIFKHQPRHTDFILGRSTTGRDGSSHYLRKIDHLFVAGQCLPNIEVPGPHSRRVTALSKSRMRMVAYRIIHKKGWVGLQDITMHVHESNDAQNRQKLKEFLRYDKENRNWVLNDNEQLMDIPTINDMIQPQEVSLLDAMMVGQTELSQQGYEASDIPDIDVDDEDNEKESTAQKSVPWKLSKNYIDASSGKAMVQVHGVGDPTGHGLGFSFIKTSMKGGYMDAIQGPAATSADAIERERKANGGHSYNVKKQDALYNEAIQGIWNRQKETLSDATPHDDDDVQHQGDEDDRFQSSAGQTRADDGVSQVSRMTSELPRRQYLKITRTVKDGKGGFMEVEERVEDPSVITQYMRHRASADAESIDPYAVKPTGNHDYDRVLLAKLESEEARLNRNKERRHAREKQKAAAAHVADGDPDSPAQSIEKGGTTRKCANCGQQGHIKTNKKLCPMLNGTFKRNSAADEGAFGEYGD